MQLPRGKENNRYKYWDFIVDRRRMPRCKYFVKADYFIEGKAAPIYKKMVMCNISSNGALLFGHGDVSKGDVMHITFKAPFYEFKQVTLTGIVVRVREIEKSIIKYLAVQFKKNIFDRRIDFFVKDINKGYYSDF